MGIIQCAEDCFYQNDGYCCLETLAPVCSLNGECPYQVNTPPSHSSDCNKKAET